MTTDRPLLLRRARRVGGDGLVDVLLRGGRVAALGPAGSLGDDTVRGAEPVDLDGRRVLPGLWDAHAHLTQWALARARLDVAGATSAAHAARLVADRFATAPPGPDGLLVGQGFRDGLWPDAPTADLLDAVAGEVPVVLVSGDLHCAWASTAGLRHLGVPHRASGLVREAEWLDRMAALDRVGDAATDALVTDALRDAAARGVVGVVDLEIADNRAVWRRRSAPDLPVRVRAAVWEQHLDAVLAEGLRTGDALDATGLVTQGPLKVITDGALNTRTAWCHDPYPGLRGPDAHGVLTVPPDRLVPLMARAAEHGLTCAIHAIGDAANGVALDAFAASGARGSVEHVQLVTADDVQRFAALGVMASVQPEHAMDDRDVADRYWHGRTARAFAYAALHAAGVRLALGSDAPVAPLDPWAAVDAAVTRRRDGRPAWHPEQRLDLDVALAASVDGVPPDLRVGGPADVVVLDDDPAALLASVGSVRGTRVAGTLVGGRWTHRAL
ncbi:amidohydrolase [Cellulomonas shaoxiangyii]|uniref:Amidohydrolase n=1 Tax=Cellulomonas shaoxiangyii TaxID=2566013 RepID=A0A4P7SIV2_9CELL|nr:amidohydrolase family protein [Cellulomonas shaoxiangyii]QCB92614.1 amidohydrolase [Cellulomonas shaoxiangyii]TGY85230.1 amidohydrolase [Cellulomonas shaoxiangyii]